jgi:hypothetical protein
MNSWVRFKPYISFLLLVLMSCNALLSATGGVFLSFHHDFSFHLDTDVAGVEQESAPSHSVVEMSDHTHHHHHDLKLTADMDPTLRGNTFDRVQAPILVVAMNLFDSNLALPVRSMRGGSAIRPPPEATPNYLAPLRTQVLRL